MEVFLESARFVVAPGMPLIARSESLLLLVAGTLLLQVAVCAGTAPVNHRPRPACTLD